MSELWIAGPTPLPAVPARTWFGGRAHWWLLLAGLVGILFDQYLASGRWRIERSEQRLAASGTAGGIGAGARIMLNGTGSAAALQGQLGWVESVSGTNGDVRLDSRLMLAQFPLGGVTLVPPGLSPMPGASMTPGGNTGGVTTGPNVYAPFASDATLDLVKQQAARLRTALEKAAALQSTQPAWAQMFWQAVKNEVDLVGLQDKVKTLLVSHGYVGPSTLGPPRVEELKKQFAELEVLGVTPHGLGGMQLQAPALAAVASDPEQMAWHLKLPADMQRAGPEIYRNIRAEGVASVRQWVNEQHTGLESRNTSQYQDLFTAATIIDFELADCQSEALLMSRLATSDTLEIQLRKLGSFIYYRRTKDKNGAMRMLGVRAPGTNADIAPKWMLDDANVFSKAEYQRLERGRKLSGLEGGGGSGQPKGGGKGRKGGGRHGGCDHPVQWAPSGGLTQPSLEDFVSHNNLWPLLPLPLPESSPWKKLRSCRLRERKKRLRVTRAAAGIVKVINSLHYGRVYDPRLTSPMHSKVPYPCDTTARALALKHVLSKAALEVRARRDFGLTGVRAMAALLKAPLDESGYVRPSGVRQVPMNADVMVEPSNVESIDMLAALPYEDREYYAAECNVVEPAGKSNILFKDIEAHYGFLGGELSEFLRYLRRPDVTHLWEWDLMDNIKAIAGVSTVLKKNGVDQRKLIMQCAANYMFGDPSKRANLGMGGGSALARVFLREDAMQVAACDEDSAFTYVKVPAWMANWQAAPPILAIQAWDLLPEDLRLQIPNPCSTYVAPKYLRLAMGGSHSVYILMRINLHHIGSTLFDYAARLRVEREDALVHHATDMELVKACCDDDLQLERATMLSDELWPQRQAARRFSSGRRDGWTVDEWCAEVRRTKHSNSRVFVATIHMFGGERRPEDIQDYLEEMAAAAGLQLLMLTVDLADDHHWDFTLPSLLHQLLLLAHEGLIDFWIGGPPCSTVARARHVPLPGGGGPRPLRFRWALWGRPDLRPFEKERVIEANTLWLNFLAVAEAVACRGGGYLMEHPADPGCDPYPSIWITEEVLGMESRVGGRRFTYINVPFVAFVRS
eukprot:Skav207006  [mRNA]  locus=scaffold1554:6879:10419:- [translate_table: standard]